MHSTRNGLSRPAYILYMIRSLVESNFVPVADGDYTSAVSPKGKEAPRKDEWDTESPTKRQCLP